MGFGQPRTAARVSPNAEEILTTKMGIGLKRQIPAWALTLVVRNVPKERALMDLLDTWVPDGSYDLIYFPYNMKSKCRLGYCFINFTSHTSALEFVKVWHGKPFPGDVRKEQLLDITAAKIQGVAATLELFRGKRIELMNDPEVLPAIFHGTQRQDVREILLNRGLVTMPEDHGDGSMRI